jgi:2-keto-3-deoxy-6-phosphogluconate aldolase
LPPISRRSLRALRDADAADAGDYLALPGVTACVCGWPAFVNAVEAGDGARASALAAETLQAMLGLRWRTLA